ncbi:unnamed protein product, partial [Ceratitis capitata]
MPQHAEEGNCINDRENEKSQAQTMPTPTITPILPDEEVVEYNDDGASSDVVADTKAEHH